MDGDTQKRPTSHRSPGDWQEVLHRALPDFCCAACGAPDWEALGPDWGSEDQVGVLHFAHWKTGLLSGYIGSIAFSCRRCGKIELFAENYLLERAGMADDG